MPAKDLTGKWTEFADTRGIDAKYQEDRDRLRDAAHHWRSIAALNDAQAMALIRTDGIDILVDLAGHTDGDRLCLFAARAAPVQVTWMGFWGTTGLDTIDYILADDVLVPPAQEKFYTEKVWRLPGCFLCYTPPRRDIPVGPFPVHTNGHVTFGSFNRLAKITPETVAAWSQILKRVEASHLLLKAFAFADPARRESVVTAFAAHGIEAKRLILEGHSPPAEALAAYNRVDIALDSFPFGGGATTADALWMGVPLVTLSGDRWVGRMSKSILTTLELSQLVADDMNSYVDLACRLANEIAQQPGLRTQLRARVEASAFYDGAAFTRGLETAYRAMWRKWCG